MRPHRRRAKNAKGGAASNRERTGTEARTAERIPALEAMELSRKDDVAFLHFHVNDQKLSPLPRA